MLMASEGCDDRPWHGHPWRGRRLIASWCVAVIVPVMAMLSSCGQAEFIYVANSDEKTYVRIPSDWQQVDETVIDDHFTPSDPESAVGQIRRSLRWSVSYDASDDPTPEHMTTAATSVDPILYLTIRHLPPAEQATVSYDYMRDAFTYVTDSGRQLAANAGYDMSTFELLHDEVLPAGEDGLHGVRVIFNFEMRTGVLHTFDQTAWANADSSILYLLLIRCTAKCYRERVTELDGIATSFTVRSKA
jgi:hypothetical protein